MHARRVTVATVVYFALAAVATVGCALAGRSAWHTAETLGGARWISLPAALAAGSLTGLAAVAVTQRFARHTRWGRTLTSELASALTGLEPRAILWLALSSAFGEELLFRGAIQAGMVDHGGAPQGLLLASLLFGLAHVPANRRMVPWTVMAAAMGLVFGALYLWTGEILAPIAAHAIVNFVNLRFLVARSPVVTDVRSDHRGPLPRAPGVGR